MSHKPEQIGIGEQESVKLQLYQLGIEVESFSTIEKVVPENPDSLIRAYHLEIHPDKQLNGNQTLDALGVLNQGKRLDRKKLEKVMAQLSVVIIDNVYIDTSELKSMSSVFGSEFPFAQLLHVDLEDPTGVESIYTPALSENLHERGSSTYIAHPFEYAQTAFAVTGEFLKQPQNQYHQIDYFIEKLAKAYESATGHKDDSYLELLDYNRIKARMIKSGASLASPEEVDSVASLYAWLHSTKRELVGPSAYALWTQILKAHKNKTIKVPARGTRLLLYNDALSGGNVVHGRGYQDEEDKEYLEIVKAKGFREQPSYDLKFRDIETH